MSEQPLLACYCTIFTHNCVFYCFECLSTNSIQMCSLTVDMMKEKGLTEGAAKKLHKKLEELRSVIFILHIHSTHM